MGTWKREGKRSWKGSKEVKGASKVVKDSDMICDLRFCHKRTKKNNTNPHLDSNVHIVPVSIQYI
jgi:hypothetical protein